MAVGLLFACGLVEAGSRMLLAKQIRAFQGTVAQDPGNLYNLFRPDETMGWVHSPGASVTVTDVAGHDPYTVTINSQGLPDREYAIDHPAQGFRVLVLGDSFVEGVQVAPQERAFTMLENRYQARWGDIPYEIIEMGTARYSPGQYYRAYQEQGRAYHPDVVIAMIFLGNDVAELSPHTGHNEITGLAGRTFEYTLEDGQLVSVPLNQWHPPSGSSRVNASAPLLRGLDIWLGENSTFYKVVVRREMETQSRHQIGLEGGSIPQAALFEANYADPLYTQVWPVFDALIVALRDAAQQDGAQFAVVIAPDMYAVYPDWYFEQYPWAADQRALFDGMKTERRVTALLDAQGIPYVSLTPFLQAAAPTSEAPLYYRANDHWTAAGHAVVIEALDGWFNQMGWAAAGQ